MVTDNTYPQFKGLGEFREKLKDLGFTIGFQWSGSIAKGNECNWYAYKRCGIDGPNCFHNDRPPNLSLTPFGWQTLGNHYVKNVKIEFTSTPSGNSLSEQFNVNVTINISEFDEKFEKFVTKLKEVWVTINQ